MTKIEAIREVRKGQFVVDYLCDYCNKPDSGRKSHNESVDSVELHGPLGLWLELQPVIGRWLVRTAVALAAAVLLIWRIKSCRG